MYPNHQQHQANAHHARRGRRRRTLGQPITAPPVTLRPGPINHHPDSAAGQSTPEARTARLVIMAFNEPHRPAQLTAARAAAEEIMHPQGPSMGRMIGHMSEERAREIVLCALREVCRRRSPMARLWTGIVRILFSPKTSTRP